MAIPGLSPFITNMENNHSTLLDFGGINPENRVLYALMLSEVGYIVQSIELSEKYLEEGTIEEQMLHTMNLIISYFKIYNKEKEVIMFNHLLNLEKKNTLETSQLIKIYRHKALCYYNIEMNDIPKAKSYLDLDPVIFDGEPFLYAKFLIDRANILHRFEFDRVSELLDTTRKANETYKSKLLYFIINSYHVIALYNNSHYEKAREAGMKLLKYPYILQGTLNLAQFYVNYAGVYEQLGKMTEALHWRLMAVDVLEQYGYQSNLHQYYRSVANTYVELGDYDKPMEYFEKAEKILKTYPNKHNLASLYLSMGNAVHDMGEHEKAKMYFQQGTELLGDSDDQFLKTALMNGTAWVMLDRGEYGGAEKLFITAYENFYKLDKKVVAIKPLKNALLCKIMSGNFNEYELYLSKLYDIYHEEANEQVDLTIQLFQGKFYQFVADEPNYELAESYYMNILDRETDVYHFKVRALFRMCEIKVTRLAEELDPKYINEAIIQIGQLIDIAKKMKSYPLLLEVMRLKAKIMVVNYDLDNALGILKEGLDLAEKQKITEKAQNMGLDINEIRETSNKWKSIKDSTITLEQRMIETKLLEFVKSKAASVGLSPDF